LRPEASRSGDLVDLDGRVLGQHRGIMHYTIGQRRGLGLAQSLAGGGEPLYVIKLDAARARVVVGPRGALGTASVMLRDVNWIGDGPLDAAIGRAVAVRLRSTRPPVPAVLQRTPQGALLVELGRPEAGVSPGQACVFYASVDEDARVLGGGVVRSPISAAGADGAPGGSAVLAVA
jgi:tRNA-specific 2-thiouridylase